MVDVGDDGEVAGVGNGHSGSLEGGRGAYLVHGRLECNCDACSKSQPEE